MTIDKNDKTHIIADEGKVFMRKETGEIMSNELYLGLSMWIGGVYLETPHEDKVEDFVEIDEPQNEEEHDND